jgi:hypothetical protein
MQPEGYPASQPEPDKVAAADARLTIERAEAAWQRQLEGEDVAVPLSGSRMLRIVLLGIAIAGIVLLLFQRLGQIG